MFVILCVCTVTDFSGQSGEDKASGVKYILNIFRYFRGVLCRESPILGNFAPQKPKIGRNEHYRQIFRNTSVPLTDGERTVRARARPRHVDIRQSPKTDVLVIIRIAIIVLVGNVMMLLQIHSLGD